MQHITPAGKLGIDPAALWCELHGIGKNVAYGPLQLIRVCQRVDRCIQILKSQMDAGFQGKLSGGGEQFSQIIADIHHFLTA